MIKSDAVRSITPAMGNGRALMRLPALTDYRVTVLVPTFNRANYIGECLDSLLAQTMPALEIIVIDDGSDDGTAEVLHSYGNRIRHVRKDNGGKPTAVNLGLSLAQGNLIWIFDDDDVALPDAIAYRVSALQSCPEAGFVYTPHYYGHDDTNGKIQRGRLHAVPSYAPDRFFFELMKGCFFHLATTLVRADVYRAVGNFDTELLSSEDYDMQIRLAQHCSAVYCPNPCFIFRQHSGARGSKIIRYAESHRVKVFQKFDQRIGEKLRANVPLGDYLVTNRVDVSESVLVQQALLGRMTVMASKGCLPEMMQDLQSMLARLPVKANLEQRVRDAIADAICTGYAADAVARDCNAFTILLADLPKTNAGRCAIRSIAKGMFRLAKGYPGSIHHRWLRLRQAFVVMILSLSN